MKKKLLLDPMASHGHPNYSVFFSFLIFESRRAQQKLLNNVFLKCQFGSEVEKTVLILVLSKSECVSFLVHFLIKSVRKYPNFLKLWKRTNFYMGFQ